MKRDEESLKRADEGVGAPRSFLTLIFPKK